MTSKHLREIGLVGVLTLALSANAEADKLQKDADTAVALAAVGIAAIITVVVLAVHQANAKRTVTGCVNRSQNGMTVTDEKNQRLYVLSGDTSGVKPGDRMTLHLKKIKPKASPAPTWETQKITKDFGACQP